VPVLAYGESAVEEATLSPGAAAPMASWVPRKAKGTLFEEVEYRLGLDRATAPTVMVTVVVLDVAACARPLWPPLGPCLRIDPHA
jgi:hypothetical protein